MPRTIDLKLSKLVDRHKSHLAKAAKEDIYNHTKEDEDDDNFCQSPPPTTFPNEEDEPDNNYHYHGMPMPPPKASHAADTSYSKKRHYGTTFANHHHNDDEIHNTVHDHHSTPTRPHKIRRTMSTTPPKTNQDAAENEDLPGIKREEEEQHDDDQSIPPESYNNNRGETTSTPQALLTRVKMEDNDDEEEPIVGQDRCDTLDPNKDMPQSPFHDHHDNHRTNPETPRPITTGAESSATLLSYVVRRQSTEEHMITRRQSTTTTTTTTTLPIHEDAHHHHAYPNDTHHHHDNENVDNNDEEQVVLSKLTQKILHNQQLQNTIRAQDQQLETLQNDYHASHRASQQRERALKEQVDHLSQLLASAKEAKNCMGEQFRRSRAESAQRHREELAQAQEMARQQAAQEQQEWQKQEQWQKQVHELERQLHQSKDHVQYLEQQRGMAKQEEKNRMADLQRQLAKSESERKQMTAKLQEARETISWWQDQEMELKKDLRKEQDYARQDRADRKRIQREMEDLCAKMDEEKRNMGARLERAWAREAKLEKDWQRDKEQARHDYDGWKQVQRNLESKVSRYQTENQRLTLQLQAAQQSIDNNKLLVETESGAEELLNTRLRSPRQPPGQPTTRDKPETQTEPPSLELDDRFIIALVATFRVGPKPKKHNLRFLHYQTLQILHKRDPTLTIHSRTRSKKIPLDKFPMEEKAFATAFKFQQDQFSGEVTVSHIITSNTGLNSLKRNNQPLFQHLTANKISLNSALANPSA